MFTSLTPCRLAAVDMHTAQHLVDYALTGHLVTNRTVILVTHHVRLCLPVAAYVVELEHGHVLRQGTPRDLRHFGMLKQVVREEDAVPQDAPPTPHPQENEADDKMVAEMTRKKTGSGKLVEKEARAEGRISLTTYLTYIRAARMSSWILTFLLMLAIRGIDIAQQVSLSQLSP
jgi:ABC-type multidrug transport system ATPase subunit